MNWIPLFFLSVVCVLLVVALVRTLLTPSKKSSYVPSPDPDREALYASRLSRMVQCETVSEMGKEDPEKFRQFHAVLRELYPTVFSSLEVHDLEGSLLLKWKGKSPANPIMLMSHQDVVAPGSGWGRPPFSGEIAEGKVWGRGASDTKCSVMAFYQAVEELLLAGYEPAVDVYLSSSCTEEVGGPGAARIVDYLKARGVRLAMLCDEGGGIITDPIAGIPGNFAMVGVFEKGNGDVKFIARSAGGHASAPPKNTPLVRLGKFMASMEKKPPFAVQFLPEVEEMFGRLAPYAGFGLKFVLCNLWLFKPGLKRVLPAISPQAVAMLQTTAAFCKASGSDGFNVIPQEAWVSANLRFIPHQKAEASLSVLRGRASQFDIEMEVLHAMDPSPSLDLSGRAFHIVEEAIGRTFPGLVTSPYVVTGATDCRFYTDITDNAVRFAPVIYGPEQMKGMHGLDENIQTDCLPGAVDWYKTLIRLQETM